jgi:uncharacterized membrane protein YbhN (UPF0104 family)
MLKRVLGVVIIAIDIYWVYRCGFGDAFNDVWQAITIVTLAAIGLILIAGTGD